MTAHVPWSKCMFPGEAIAAAAIACNYICICNRICPVDPILIKHQLIKS